MRKAIVILILVAVAALGVGAANASVQGAAIGKVFLDGSGGVFQITGTIRCTSGQTFLLRVNVRSSSGSTAIGRVTGSCSGTTQDWHTKTVETSGTFSCGEPVAGHLQARTNDGNSNDVGDKAQTTCV